MPMESKLKNVKLCLLLGRDKVAANATPKYKAWKGYFVVLAAKRSLMGDVSSLFLPLSSPGPVLCPLAHPAMVHVKIVPVIVSLTWQRFLSWDS